MFSYVAYRRNKNSYMIQNITVCVLDISTQKHHLMIKDIPMYKFTPDVIIYCYHMFLRYLSDDTFIVQAFDLRLEITNRSIYRVVQAAPWKRLCTNKTSVFFFFSANNYFCVSKSMKINEANTLTYQQITSGVPFIQNE